MNQDGKIEIKDGLYVCPRCGAKTYQAYDRSTHAKNLLLFCRHCKGKFYVNIESGQCFLSRCR